jgi:predicted dehydrogenase
MRNPLTVAIVGSGIISHNHAAAIARHPGLEIAAIVDPEAAAAASLATTIAGLGQPRPAAYADLATALASSTVDIVVICSPSGTHGDVAEAALSSGRHVVVEKPLEASLPAGRRRAAAAAAAVERGQVVTVISQHRFDPASAVVARAIAEGRLGRLTSAVASVPWWRTQDYYDAAGWRGTWAFDGGAVMNQAVHTVDLLVWFMGPPVEVFAQSARLAHERIETEDVAVATLRFPSGALAVLHATTAGYPGLEVRIQVQGTRGSAVVHADQLESLVTEEPFAAGVLAADCFGAPKPDDSFVIGHLRQYHDIAKSIVDGRPPGVGIDDGITALATVLAVYASAALGRPVTLDEVLRGDHDDVEFGSAL